MFKSRVHQVDPCSFCSWRKWGAERINETCHTDSGKELWQALRSPNNSIISVPEQMTVVLPWWQIGTCQKFSPLNPSVLVAPFSTSRMYCRATWTMNSHLDGWTTTHLQQVDILSAVLLVRYPLHSKAFAKTMEALTARCVFKSMGFKAVLGKRHLQYRSSNSVFSVIPRVCLCL